MIATSATATIDMWVRGSSPAPAASAPTPAPASAPNEKAAWKEAKISRSWRLFSATACAFMLTSSTPLAAPSATIAAQNVAGDGARPGSTSAPA